MQEQQHKSRKQEMTEILTNLNKIKEVSPTVQAFLRYLTLLLEDKKEALFQANPSTFAPLQGEAIAISELIRTLSRTHIPIPKE